ncbi:hypothetical protein BJX70DRAFT_355031 [Aspergillus crustosus]
MVYSATDLSHSTSDTPTDHTTVTLVRSRRGCYRVLSPETLQNNLLAGVGFLELANAGDFAANVWNNIPVPRHAVILMAIGGPITLLVSLVAARDAYLSWKNVSLLYAERKRLLSSPYRDDTTSAILSVNTRELGSEIIDRMLMDIFLGFGALLVGAGTIMAIWGADHRIFQASNLLSGYVGNSCSAIFGVINACWSSYLVYRFQLRYSACLSDLTAGSQSIRLRRRFRRFQWHAAVNGINGIVAGMASMVTAKMWWGYVVLIPCVVVMIALNLLWKMKLGYDRPIWKCSTRGDEEKGETIDVLATLVSVETARDRLQQLIQAPTLDIVLGFIIDNGMFSSFCQLIAQDWPAHHLFPVHQTTIDISPSDLRAVLDDERAQLMDHCQRVLHQRARILLEHRQRYLLEVLGEIQWTRDQDKSDVISREQ